MYFLGATGGNESSSSSESRPVMDPDVSPASSTSAPETTASSSTAPETTAPLVVDIEDDLDEAPESGGKVYNKPAQEKLEKQIKDLRDKIEALEKIRDAGLATQDNIKQLKASRVELEKTKATLRKKTQRSQAFQRISKTEG